MVFSFFLVQDYCYISGQTFNEIFNAHQIMSLTNHLLGKIDLYSAANRVLPCLREGLDQVSHNSLPAKVII